MNLVIIEGKGIAICTGLGLGFYMSYLDIKYPNTKNIMGGDKYIMKSTGKMYRISAMRFARASDYIVNFTLTPIADTTCSYSFYDSEIRLFYKMFKKVEE